MIDETIHLQNCHTQLLSIAPHTFFHLLHMYLHDQANLSDFTMCPNPPFSPRTNGGMSEGQGGCVRIFPRDWKPHIGTCLQLASTAAITCPCWLDLQRFG